MVTKIGQRFPKSKLTFFVGLCINDLLGGWIETWHVEVSAAFYRISLCLCEKWPDINGITAEWNHDLMAVSWDCWVMDQWQPGTRSLSRSSGFGLVQFNIFVNVSCESIDGSLIKCENTPRLRGRTNGFYNRIRIQKAINSLAWGGKKNKLNCARNKSKTFKHDSEASERDGLIAGPKKKTKVLPLL